MLFPLGTDRPLRRSTRVTYALLAANIAVFAVQFYLRQAEPERADELWRWGAVSGQSFHWYQLLTSSFLHADSEVWHILFNMLFLWVFGPNIEDRLGRVWFLLFYLAGGAVAMGVHALVSRYPAIGASGAVSALTGAYLVMFPRTMVRVFWIFTLGVVWMPAWWFIGFAIVWDLGAGLFGRDTGIAHAAHLGGTAFGVAVAYVLLATKMIPGEPYDLFFQTKQAYRRRQIREATAGFSKRVEKQLAPKRGESTAEKQAAAEAEAMAVLRAEVARLMGAGDIGGASAAYRRLADTYGHLGRAAVLSRKHQYDLAAWLYQRQDFASAAYAYERFLEAYPKDVEAAQIRLLLGRINARHLNDPVRAKALLNEALPALRDESTRALAKQELEALG